MAYEVKSSGEPVSFHFAGLEICLLYLEFSSNISDLSLPNASVSVNLDDAIDHPAEALQLIVSSEFGLGKWPLPGDHLLQIAKMSMLLAMESLLRLPPSDHNYFGFQFSLSDHQEIHEDDYVLELDEDDQGVIINMVPATELSIGNLERKKPRVSGSGCPVCLEDFSMDCEVVHMPCSHGFHGDCIQKWLRKSHYCPLCRFEMPTS